MSEALLQSPEFLGLLACLAMGIVAAALWIVGRETEWIDRYRMHMRWRRTRRNGRRKAGPLVQWVSPIDDRTAGLSKLIATVDPSSERPEDDRVMLGRFGCDGRYRVWSPPPPRRSWWRSLRCK